MSLFKKLLCKHEFVFVRNIYGDEIIERGWKRSIWRCDKCGSTSLRADLHGCEVKGGPVVKSQRETELEKESEYYRVNRDLTGHAYLEMLAQKNELVAKNTQYKKWLSERDDYAESLRAEIYTLEIKLQECVGLLEQARRCVFDMATPNLGPTIDTFLKGVTK